MSTTSHMNWSGVFPCEPDWRWDTAETPLPDFDLWAVFGGRGHMALPDDSVIPLARGDCLLLRPGQRYICHTDASDPLLVHVIHYDYLGPRGRVVRLRELPPIHRPLLDVELFRALTQRAIDAHLDGHAEIADDWLRVTLHELARQDAARAAGDKASDAPSWRIEKVRAGIIAEPGRRWRVGELAASCRTSPDHFTRLFRDAYGVTPREFISRQRIDAARRLLLSSSHSVGRIAQLMGFSDIYHFSRQFKARVGRSPSQFRSLGTAT